MLDLGFFMRFVRFGGFESVESRYGGWWRRRLRSSDEELDWDGLEIEIDKRKSSFWKSREKCEESWLWERGWHDCNYVKRRGLFYGLS